MEGLKGRGEGTREEEGRRKRDGREGQGMIQDQEYEGKGGKLRGEQGKDQEEEPP
jgi:hypothetical protein